MAAPLLVALLGALAACANAQPDLVGSRPAQSIIIFPQNFTGFTETFYMSLNLLTNTTEISGVACAAKCNANAVCTDWAWCPLDQFDGCELVPFGPNVTANSKASPGTCLNSYDKKFPPRKIYMGMVGTNWHGGYRIFPNATSDSGSGGQVSPTPAPSPSGSGGGSSGGSCPIKIQANTYLSAYSAGSSNYIDTTKLDVPDANTCCNYCAASAKCQLFTYCDIKAPSCNRWDDFTKILGDPIKQGSCLLWSVKDPKGVTTFDQSPTTPWASGQKA